jgi:hypothetical protein
MSELVPLAYDTHPDYYDLNIPDPVVTRDAEKFMDWLNWQQSMVPEVFQGEPWAIYDLEAYQAFISDYISVKAEEENGKSIYTQDGPFITGEIKKGLR